MSLFRNDWFALQIERVCWSREASSAVDYFRVECLLCKLHVAYPWRNSRLVFGERRTSARAAWNKGGSIVCGVISLNYIWIFILLVARRALCAACAIGFVKLPDVSSSATAEDSSIASPYLVDRSTAMGVRFRVEPGDKGITCAFKPTLTNICK